MRNLLEETFQKFCELQAQDHNLSTPEEFAVLNQTELLVLLGDSYNPKDFDFDDEKVLKKIFFLLLFRLKFFMSHLCCTLCYINKKFQKIQNSQKSRKISKFQNIKCDISET